MDMQGFLWIGNKMMECSLEKGQTDIRHRLQDELEEILEHEVYIYGAGIVGKRLYQVIKGISLESHVLGFIVTEKKEHQNGPDGKEIFCLDDFEEKSVSILLAVGDVYQNEILSLLNQRGFWHVSNGYRYSLLNEEHILDDMPAEIPDRIEISIDELMMMQFQKGEFGRYDIFYEIWNGNQTDIAPEPKQEVEVDDGMRICGSTRQMADLLVRQIPTVRIHQIYDKRADIYGKDWLQETAPSEAIPAICDMLEQYHKKWNRSFLGILWPPAQEYFDEILYALEGYAIIQNYYDFDMSNHAEEFIRSVYGTDDTEPWIIRDKIKRIQDENEKKCRIVHFIYEEPDFRIKRYGHTISRYGVQTKQKIREAFKDKIDRYVYDVVIHTTDNFTQTEAVEAAICRFREKSYL
jgi:hypothetical protein